MSRSSYKFIMISAMYENGGNTTQRYLDGNPQLYVYPFESQPGTKHVIDHLTSLYPQKYRWPVFPNSASIEELYNLIIDEEAKIRSKTPLVSKFKDADFKFSDKDRFSFFAAYLKGKDITRSTIMEAFFVATFKAWKNYRVSGKEKYYVGYSPIVGVDGAKIIDDYKKNAYVLHVVRNPFSAYADTKKRPVPLSLDHYVLGWVISQYYALLYASMYPKNFFIIQYEDLINNSKKTFSHFFSSLGISFSDRNTFPSWNGQKLESVYPWGTIKLPTPDVNISTARELSKEEIKQIYLRARFYIDHFNYRNIYQRIIK